MRIRNLFRGGGGGGGGPCLSDSSCPQLILQFIEGVQWFDYNRENYTFLRIQRGSNISQEGGSNFSRGGRGGGCGVLIIIFKETHITCDFLGGGGGLDP